MTHDNLSLWVWEDVLADYTPGIAFAVAVDEAAAWEALRAADATAYWSIRGEQREDNRTPDELHPHQRPRRVEGTAAFTCWGGA